MSYQTLRLAAIVLTVIAAFIGFVQAADPVSLGLTPILARWLGIVGGVIGVILGFLPRVQESERRVTDQGPPATTDLDAALKREAQDT